MPDFLNIELFLSLCLGLGLSAACGFRVFVPLLVTNIAYLTGYAHPQVGFEWMSSWTAFGILATATVLEIGAYYIPWLDNLLDTIAMPTAFIAGTVLMTSLLDDGHPILRWGLGLILGGGSAGLIQAGTSVLRLGSTATTGGIGNPVVSTFENIFSILLAIFSLLLPILVAIGVVIFLWYVSKKLLTRKSNS